MTDQTEMARILAYVLEKLLDDEMTLVARHTDGGIRIDVKSDLLKQPHTIFVPPDYKLGPAKTQINALLAFIDQQKRDRADEARHPQAENYYE